MIHLPARDYIAVQARRLNFRFRVTIGDPRRDEETGVAKKSEGLLQVRAARAALTLSRERQIVSVLRQLFETANATLVSVTVEFLLDHNEQETSGFLQDYLDSPDENIREKVLVYYAKNYSKDELEEVLVTYEARPVYYYNVVCWLDRIIYAPSPLKEMFLRELESKLWIDLGIFGKSEAFDTAITTLVAPWW